MVFAERQRCQETMRMLGINEIVAKRIYDANHAYYASACDYFVTDDRKTCNKANVAYYIMGLKTKAISNNEFLALTK